MKKIVLAPVLRARALEALKATWPTMLAASALIQLVSYVLNQVIGAIPMVGPFLSYLVIAAMSVPMLGLTSGVLGYYRGKPLTLDCMKAMFPHWQKACLLCLWTMLCLVGWMLLGMAVVAVGGTMLKLSADGTAMIAIGGLLAVAGMVLMLVLIFRAALDYSMANCILVDDPSTGVREKLRKSKAMIRGYRWYSVKVQWPVLLVIFIAGTIIGGLTAALPVWLASLFSSAMGVFIGMLGYYFQPLVYEELRRIGR